MSYLSYKKQKGNSYNIRNKKVHQNKDDIKYQVAYAEMHFGGKVPKIKDEPRFEQFGLSQNIVESMEKEREEKKKKIEHDNLTLKTFLISALMIILGALFGINMREGIFYACYVTVNLAMAAFILYELLFTILKKDEKNIHVNYEKEYQQYQDAALAYNYWKIMKTVKYWDKLDGHEFENKVALLFRQKGYDALVSKAGGDGGIDIVLTSGNEKIAVQCKAHNKAVAPSVARDLYGTMIAGGFYKGMIVSKNGFTKGVYDFVKGKQIELLDMEDLIKMASTND